MVWPHWDPGEVPVQVEGFPQCPWSHMIPNFPHMGRKMSLALPCLGLDALSTGLREIQWGGFEIAYAYDIDESLIPVLLHTHGPKTNLHIGCNRGNLLACKEEDWSRVDFVISGPPCPPFSSIGAHRARAEDDPREAVFQKVTKIIISQGKKRCFGFIVEMVLGITHRSREKSYYDTWLEQLHRDAPMFCIETWLMNSIDYVPQHRARIYTVGVLRELLGDVGIPPPMPRSSMRAPLGDCLHKGLPPVDEKMLTPHQKNNLSKMKQLMQARLQQKGHHLPSTPTMAALGRFQPAIACFSVDRDMDKQFSNSLRWDDAAPTLRTGNEMLWLLKFSVTGALLISRCLHPVERLALQSFPPELARYMTKTSLLRTTGNSFTVPVVVAVFRQCLVSIALRHPPATGSVTMSCFMSRTQEEIAAILAKRRRINELREEIAILDTELQLQEQRFHAVAAGLPSDAHHVGQTGD